MQRLLVITCAALLFLTAACRAEDVAALLQRITAAQKGAVVRFPEGTIALGNVTVPDGVTLKGAGYDKTFLDATGKEFGVKLGAAASADDLTVSGAAQAGVLVDGVSGVNVARVRVRGCGSGLLARDAVGCRFSNLLIADCYAGVNLAHCTASALVNATVANIASCAMRVGHSTQVAVFNNLFTYAATGISVNGDNPGCVIDHNLYIASFVGAMDGETTRKQVEAWATLSGYDTHSLTIGVTYKDAPGGDFRPVSPLSWAPVRATSSGWGVAECAGVKAPLTDIDGAKRSGVAGSLDLGAYEVTFPAPRKADGVFTVKSGLGITSAGLFTKDNRCVRYLFQELPLAKGTYSYWLPSRDWQGRAIPAGNYTLKLTEAKLNLDYVAAAGNGDLPMSTTSLGNVRKRASLNTNGVTFDAAGRLIVAQDGFESGQHVRAYDETMSKFTWSYGGGGDVKGMAVDEKGRLLVMRAPASLLRLDAATGGKANFSNDSCTRRYDAAFKGINGIAWCQGRLYVADTAANKLLFLSGDDLDITGSVDSARREPARSR